MNAFWIILLSNFIQFYGFSPESLDKILSRVDSAQAERPSIDELVKWTHEYAASESAQKDFDQTYDSQKLMAVVEGISQRNSDYAREVSPALNSFIYLALRSQAAKVDPSRVVSLMSEILPRSISTEFSQQNHQRLLINIRWNRDILRLVEEGKAKDWHARELEAFYKAAQKGLDPLLGEINKEIEILRIKGDEAELRSLERSKAAIQLQIANIGLKALELRQQEAQMKEVYTKFEKAQTPCLQFK